MKEEEEQVLVLKEVVVEAEVEVVVEAEVEVVVVKGR